MVKVNTVLDNFGGVPTGIPEKIDRLANLRDRKKINKEDEIIEKPKTNYFVDFSYEFLSDSNSNRSTNFNYDKGLLSLLRGQPNNYAGGSYVIKAEGITTDVTLHEEILEAPIGLKFQVKNLTTGYDKNRPNCPFEVWLSNDKSEWVLLYQDPNSSTTEKVHTMSGEARYVKLKITQSINGTKEMFFGIYDNGTIIKPFGKFWDIQIVVPEEVQPDKTLIKSWEGGFEATYNPDGTINDRTDIATDIHTNDDVSPSGKVFFDSSQLQYPGNDAYIASNVFDQSGSSTWRSSGGTAWLAYKFNSPKQINVIKISSSASGSKGELARHWDILGSNDSTDGSDGTWTKLGTEASGHPVGGLYPTVTNKFINAQKYNWYKIQLRSNWGGGGTWINEIQFTEAKAIPLTTIPYSIMDIITGNNKPIDNDDTLKVMNITAPDSNKLKYEEIWGTDDNCKIAMSFLKTGFYKNGSEEILTCPFTIYGSDDSVNWTELYSSPDYLNYVKTHTFTKRKFRFVKFVVISDGRGGADKARIFFDNVDNFIYQSTATTTELMQLGVVTSGIRLEASDLHESNHTSNTLAEIQSGTGKGTNLFEENSILNKDIGLTINEVYDAGQGWKFHLDSFTTSGIKDSNGYKGSTPFVIFTSDDGYTWEESYKSNIVTTDITVHNVNKKARYFKIASLSSVVVDDYVDRLVFGPSLVWGTTYTIDPDTKLVPKTSIIKVPYTTEILKGEVPSIDESVHILNDKLTSDTLIPLGQNGLTIGLDTRGHTVTISKGSRLIAL